MKILFVASECVPFVKTGGLADVLGALPKQLNKEGINVSVMLPYYKSIKDKYNLETTKSFLININGKNKYCGICELQYEGITYYFIDNNYFFYREGNIYGHFDDGERFAYFNLAVLESLRELEMYPDILHLNDWHTGSIPYLLNAKYKHIREYKKIKTVYTIHNIEHQGKFPKELAPYFNLEYNSVMEFDGMINFMKMGIVDADIVTTVSETYAKEIESNEYSFGLSPAIIEKKEKFVGIINGIDYQIFDPAIDSIIYYKYDVNSLSFKEKNKIELKKEFDFPRRKAPLLGMVTRLVDQKGIDLIKEIIEDLVFRTNAMFVLMGTGDPNYEALLNYLTKKHPYNIKVYIGYNEIIAHKIYAACDMFIMPSKYEPCGLSQLISLKYGTIPIVRETGGLKDSIKPYNKFNNEGWGFSFSNYNAYELSDCITTAIKLYESKKGIWQDLIKKAMKLDFSWQVSAIKYIKLYEGLVKKE